MKLILALFLLVAAVSAQFKHLMDVTFAEVKSINDQQFVVFYYSDNQQHMQNLQVWFYYRICLEAFPIGLTHMI
jgi:hypothetical protein